MVRANGVDVHGRGQVGAEDDRLRGRRRGANDVGATHGFAGRRARVHGDAHPPRHFPRELLSFSGIAAVNTRGLELSNRSNGFELRARLAACSNDGSNARILARQVFGGYAGGRSGAQLPHVVGLDEREQIYAGSFIVRIYTTQYAAYVY